MNTGVESSVGVLVTVDIEDNAGDGAEETTNKDEVSMATQQECDTTDVCTDIFLPCDEVAALDGCTILVVVVVVVVTVVVAGAVVVVVVVVAAAAAAAVVIVVAAAFVVVVVAAAVVVVVVAAVVAVAAVIAVAVAVVVVVICRVVVEATIQAQFMPGISLFYLHVGSNMW